jgi:hypothetical protein
MEERNTLNLSIFLGTVGIFIPVVLQIIYANFNYSNLNENLVVLQYLLLPAIYFISSAVIYFKKINSKLINGIIMMNVLLVGVLIFFFSIIDKIDALNINLQFFLTQLFTLLLYLAFIVLPSILLVILIFYNSFKECYYSFLKNSQTPKNNRK